MRGSIWSQRTTRTGIIAAIVLILAGGACLWYIRTTRTAVAGVRAAAMPDTVQTRRLVKASASTPLKSDVTPHSLSRQPAKEAGEHNTRDRKD
jgi:hypothetical protein